MLPGAISIGLGVAYAAFLWSGRGSGAAGRGAADGGAAKTAPAVGGPPPVERGTLVRVLAIIMFTTAIGGLIFQSTTFALPKIFDERLTELAGSATAIGGYAFTVFTVAAFAQLAVGYLVDHHSLRTVFAFVAALQAAFFAVMYQLTGLAALVVAVGFMLVVFGQIPINDVLIGRITKSEWRSRVYSLRYIVTFSVSASTLPLIAWIHGSWGFDRLFVVMRRPQPAYSRRSCSCRVGARSSSERPPPREPPPLETGANPPDFGRLRSLASRTAPLRTVPFPGGGSGCLGAPPKASGRYPLKRSA